MKEEPPTPGPGAGAARTFPTGGAAPGPPEPARRRGRVRFPKGASWVPGRSGWLVAGALAAGVAPSAGAPSLDPSCQVRVVSRQELVQAMRQIQGYEIAATTNAPRFGAQVFLHLAAEAIAGGGEGLLLIRQSDWFPAFLEVAGLGEEEAPPGARLAYEHRQDMLIDYTMDQVIDAVEEGPPPALALGVTIAWPHRSGGVREYSYEDTLSVPKMRVTSRRVVRYRLLAYDDMVVYDEMDGLSGRPTSGLLGVLFSIIGDARVVRSRIAVSEDGFQVVRARARKGFLSPVSIATFGPDGRGDRGVPDERSDLRALERALEAPVRVRYHPPRCDEAVGA